MEEKTGKERFGELLAEALTQSPSSRNSRSFSGAHIREHPVNTFRSMVSLTTGKHISQGARTSPGRYAASEPGDVASFSRTYHPHSYYTPFESRIWREFHTDREQRLAQVRRDQAEEIDEEELQEDEVKSAEEAREDDYEKPDAANAEQLPLPGGVVQSHHQGRISPVAYMLSDSDA